MGKKKTQDLSWDLPAGATEKEPKQASAGGGSDIPRRVLILRHPLPLPLRARRLRMWVPLLLLLPELLPAVPAQKLSALTVRPPRCWRRAPSGPVSGAPERAMRPPGGCRAEHRARCGQAGAPAGRAGGSPGRAGRPGSSAAARPGSSRHRRPAERRRGERGPGLRWAGLLRVPAELRSGVNVRVIAFICPKRNNAAVRSAFGPAQAERYYFILIIKRHETSLSGCSRLQGAIHGTARRDG